MPASPLRAAPAFAHDGDHSTLDWIVGATLSTFGTAPVRPTTPLGFDRRAALRAWRCFTWLEMDASVPDRDADLVDKPEEKALLLRERARAGDAPLVGAGEDRRLTRGGILNRLDDSRKGRRLLDACFEHY